MSDVTSSATTFDLTRKFAEPIPEMGKAVFRLTLGPGEHKHGYYIYCPWSGDGSQLLFARYDRVNPAADICVMDLATGNTQVAGKSLWWNSHTAAQQQWQGGTGRLLFRTREAGAKVLVSVFPDGSGRRVFPCEGFDFHHCSVDGRTAIGFTAIEYLFPNDEIADRSDKGLLGMDLETGETRLILSIKDAVDILPDPQNFADKHLYVKMPIVHPTLPRLLFNLTNTFWDRGGREPGVRMLISVGLDGSRPAFHGSFRHHPYWHPTEDCILANVADSDRVLRLGLYRGSTIDYVPNVKGSGHPSFSPDSRWICKDGHGERGDGIALCNPETGEATLVARFDTTGGTYASFQSIDSRPENETIIGAFLRSQTGPETWMTQAHPAWSPDGSAILFNGDPDGGSQVYVVDVNALESLKP